MIETLTPKEKQILHIAMQVFVEKGWHGTKMQEIADRAGINKAMLHYYFRSKERLYNTILEKLFVQFIISVSESFRSGETFAQTLTHFLDRYHNQLMEHPNLPLFIARELSEGGERARKVIEKTLREKQLRTPQILIKELKKAEKRGEIVPVKDPVQFLLTLIGACVYFFLARPILEPMFPDIDFNAPDFIEQRKKYIFDQLYYGLKTRGPKP